MWLSSYLGLILGWNIVAGSLNGGMKRWQIMRCWEGNFHMTKILQNVCSMPKLHWRNPAGKKFMIWILGMKSSQYQILSSSRLWFPLLVSHLSFVLLYSFTFHLEFAEDFSFLNCRCFCGSFQSCIQPSLQAVISISGHSMQPISIHKFSQGKWTMLFSFLFCQLSLWANI